MVVPSGDHSDASHMHPIPSIAHHIPSPAEPHISTGTLAQSPSPCAPAPRVPAPREDPNTRIPHSRSASFLVQAHSLLSDMPFLHGAGSGPLQHFCAGLSLLGTAFLVGKRVLVKLFQQSPACLLFV